MTCYLDRARVALRADFDHDDTRTDRYRITYAGFAIMLLDEIEAPRHDRAAISVREA